eukprot:TRINITY_DN108979_c0_g1_i1.p1 TRINITY_DN108979_c0_g1~~TRINITY_DN108979_c0_g1_i1.p1  ORF type:complete len:317 (-),score=47.16 TRINITY_DN108979_c0_g1_i1:113-1063(-)
MWELASNNFITAFTFFGIVCCAVHCWWVRILRRKNYDRLIAVQSFFVVLGIAVPTLLFALCIVFGILLALVEGWKLDAGLTYMLYISGISPNDEYNSTLDTRRSKFLCVLLASVVFAWAQTCLGFSGASSGIQRIMDAFGNRIPAVFTLTILVPCVLWFVGTIVGALVALLEEAPFEDAFLAVMDFMVAGGDLSLINLPAPTDVTSCMMKILGAWMLSLAGAILGYASCHTSVIASLQIIGSTDLPEQDEVGPDATSKFDKADAERQILELSHQVKKLQSQGEQYELRIWELEQTLFAQVQGIELPAPEHASEQRL